MDKFKINLEVSERDKKLLIIAVSVIVLVLAYYFGFTPITEKVDTYQKEVTALQSKQRELMTMNQNKEKYISDTSAYNMTYTSVVEKYRSTTSQPEAFAFLNQLELITGSWVKSVAFTDPANIYTFGKVSSTNPMKKGEAAYSSDMVGYKTTLTLAYDAEYDQWKNLISLINNYSDKNTIDNISMTYSEANGVVSGTMTVSLYTITGKDRNATEPDFDVNTGTNNIFED